VLRLTSQTIIGIEQGKYAPSLPLAFQISRAFGMSIEEIFEYAESGAKSQ